MANIRQYIGARYTIKIYENSQDAGSAEWEANTSYEPLVMVTYNNSSYLSKKNVPATIGNPAQNPSYWIVTGAYNGQIAALQAQIDDINNNKLPAITAQIQTLENKIASVSDRKYIFVGDSYGDEDYLPDVRAWWRYLADYLGLTSDKYYAACKNGGGFNRTDTTKRYISILQDIESSVTDKDTITDIVISGGYNDIDDVQTDIVTRAEELKTYIATTYPNAKIWIAPIGWTSDVTYSRLNLFRRMIFNYLSLSAIGFYPIDNGYLALHNYNLFRDPAHPTSAGNAEIAKYLFAGLTNTNYKTVVNQLIQAITVDSSASGVGTQLFNANQDGNNITAFFQCQVQYSTPLTVTADGTNKCVIGTLADGLVKGSDDGNTPISINCFYDDGTNYHSITGLLYFENGTISIAPYSFNGRTYDSLTVSRIGCARTKLLFDALNC